jgi:hypothetical protein
MTLGRADLNAPPIPMIALLNEHEQLVYDGTARIRAKIERSE